MLESKLKSENAASELGIHSDHVEFYGIGKAKISLAALAQAESTNRRGKLVLVSAITPTPSGEGKTTVSIGLAQGLRKNGVRAALALRQPSMGPVFGRKGTATGGGMSTLTPADSINLHFTGDFHAITTAHNLIAAALDNALHFKTTALDSERVLWKRVLDMNDRSLRKIRIGLDGVERESGFEITAASEIMAALCLAESYEDLRKRLEFMLIGYSAEFQPVYVKDLRITGALLAVLREALKPNLVQSVEGVPAFVHGGPFANIAHGCNSIIATRMALKFSDVVVTEAGFAFDLGGEKFMNIKCRLASIAPDAIVLVATLRALKMHGGVPLSALTNPDLGAVGRGLENLEAHVEAAKFFRRPVIVALNHFENDSKAEQQVLLDFCKALGVPCSVVNVFGDGGEGGRDLASLLMGVLQDEVPPLPFVYDLRDPVELKINKIAQVMYGADGVDFSDEAARSLERIKQLGLHDLPICMAKTQDSLSDNPKLGGRPKGFRITVRDFEIASGAGFLVALTGKILRMPALPKVPSAERLEMNNEIISGW